MYFLVHAQILADSTPITAVSYDTLKAAYSALYTGMAYDVAADAVLRSWAKICTESGQIMKEESYAKVAETTTTTNTTTDTATDTVAEATTTATAE